MFSRVRLGLLAIFFLGLFAAIIYFFGYYPKMVDYNSNIEKLEKVILEEGEKAVHKNQVQEGKIFIGYEAYTKLNGLVVSYRDFQVKYKVAKFSKDEVVLHGHLAEKLVEEIKLKVDSDYVELPRTNGWKVKVEKVDMKNEVVKLMILED